MMPHFDPTIKPRVYIATDDGEIEEIEFDAMGLCTCPAGHVHGIIMGDPQATAEAQHLLRAEIMGNEDRPVGGTPLGQGTTLLDELARLLNLNDNDEFLAGSDHDGFTPDSRQRIETAFNHPDASDELRAVMGDLLALDDDVRAGRVDPTQFGVRLAATMGRLQMSLDIVDTVEQLIDAGVAPTAAQSVADLDAALASGASMTDVSALVSNAAAEVLPGPLADHAAELARRVADYEAGRTSGRPVEIQSLKLFLRPEMKTVLEGEGVLDPAVAPYETIAEAALALERPDLVGGPETYRRLHDEALVDAALEEIANEQ